MSKIRIKYFGPIKEGYLENDGWLDVKKVTVFIGNQGAGKSTAAKVISTLTWLEKAINRGDIDIGKMSFNMFNKFFEYQKINNYLSKKTYIEYLGEKYHILYDRTQKTPIISEVENKNYIVPKIMYVPSERNFLSTISDAYNVKGLPENLFTFAEELRKAQKELSGKKIKLPIEGYSYEYDKNEEASYVSGDDYRINLIEASSGLQALIPLYLVSSSLSSSVLKTQKKANKELTVTQAVRFAEEMILILDDESLSKQEQNRNTSLVKARFFSKCFHNIVEEPEQNLFPTSQKDILFSLLKFNKLSDGNKLILTTHSPYIINYLTLSVKAEMVKSNLNSEDAKKKLDEIVPLEATLSADNLVIYELDEKDGSIKKLPDYKGLPSDENYLNNSLEESNQLFAQLQEIEKGWR